MTSTNCYKRFLNNIRYYYDLLFTYKCRSCNAIKCQQNKINSFTDNCMNEYTCRICCKAHIKVSELPICNDCNKLQLEILNNTYSGPMYKRTKMIATYVVDKVYHNNATDKHYNNIKKQFVFKIPKFFKAHEPNSANTIVKYLSHFYVREDANDDIMYYVIEKMEVDYNDICTTIIDNNA